jgi:transposase InsO family protein
MKDREYKISSGVLCRWFGIGRQACYQHDRDLTEEFFHSSPVPEEVHTIRQRHPRPGTGKLLELLRPLMQSHGIKPGRDALFDLLSLHGLPVRRRKRVIHTAMSRHRLRKYDNLIAGFTASKPDELWVSDITYWKLQEGYVYPSLITDAYSRKMAGYHLSENLHARQTVEALKPALSAMEKPSATTFELIHHSDRGVRYCSSVYVNILKKNRIRISMTQSGDPLENAIAGRVNGIIRDEYLYDYQCGNIEEGRKQLALAVALYNTERPHNSIGNPTPEAVHENDTGFLNGKETKKLGKNYWSKKN